GRGRRASAGRAGRPGSCSCMGRARAGAGSSIARATRPRAERSRLDIRRWSSQETAGSRLLVAEDNDVLWINHYKYKCLMDIEERREVYRRGSTGWVDDRAAVDIRAGAASSLDSYAKVTDKAILP